MEVKNVLKQLTQVSPGTFIELLPFNQHHFGSCDITGVSPVWEMHPETDEFFYIIDGCFEITLLTDAGAEHHLAPAGSSFVVPRGIWHKPAAPEGAKFVYFTPGQSLHSDADDPRL